MKPLGFIFQYQPQIFFFLAFSYFAFKRHVFPRENPKKIRKLLDQTTELSISTWIKHFRDKPLKKFEGETIHKKAIIVIDIIIVRKWNKSSDQKIK